MCHGIDRKTCKWALFHIALFVLVLFPGLIQAQAILNLVEKRPISFGVVPTSATRCVINNSGTVSGGCLGPGMLGEMEVTGEPYYSFSVTVQNSSWINGLKIRPKLPRQDFILDDMGKGIVYIKGVLRIREEAFDNPSGLTNIPYVFTVNYQ